MTSSPQNKASDALERRRENSVEAEAKSLSKMIRDMQGEFQKAMPRGGEAVQLVRDALTCLRTTPKLAACEAQSVLGALMTAGQLGLHVGVLGQAWPLPYWDKNIKGFRAQLIIGYQGYQELAHRSGKVASFMPRTVHEGDEFDLDYGRAGQPVLHRPPTRGLRGDIVGFYSQATYINGGVDVLYMSFEEMQAYRDKWASTRTKDGRIFGPWVEHFEAMANKTTQRRLSKSVPKARELAVASFVDGGLRVNLNPEVNPEEVTTQPDIPGELVHEEDGPAELAPIDESTGPCVDRQRKRIMALVDELGRIGHPMDRNERLAYYTHVAGRPIDSTNGLTYGEAEKVIAAMDGFKKQQGG